MLALSEKRRASVCALYDDEAPLKGDGLLIYAARTAGYGTPTSSNKTPSRVLTSDCPRNFARGGSGSQKSHPR